MYIYISLELTCVACPKANERSCLCEAKAVPKASQAPQPKEAPKESVASF